MSDLYLVTIMLFIIFLILNYIFWEEKKYKKSKINNKRNTLSFFDIFNFNKKEYEEIDKEDFSLLSEWCIFTKTELKFFIKLNNKIKNTDFILSTKIRLVDLVDIKNAEYKKYMTIFNKLSKKHIDFIITDKYWNIIVLIELDDKYHNNKKSKINDKFKNELFEYLKIPLVRFYAWNSYDFDKLDEYFTD